jgi:hypothetical protein
MWELRMEAFPWLLIWVLTLGMGSFEMSQTFGSRFWGPNLAQIKPSWNCWKVLEEYYNKVGLHSQNNNMVNLWSNGRVGNQISKNILNYLIDVLRKQIISNWNLVTLLGISSQGLQVCLWNISIRRWNEKITRLKLEIFIIGKKCQVDVTSMDNCKVCYKEGNGDSS